MEYFLKNTRGFRIMKGLDLKTFFLLYFYFFPLAFPTIYYFRLIQSIQKTYYGSMLELQCKKSAKNHCFCLVLKTFSKYVYIHINGFFYSSVLNYRTEEREKHWIIHQIFFLYYSGPIFPHKHIKTKLNSNKLLILKMQLEDFIPKKNGLASQHW